MFGLCMPLVIIAIIILFMCGLAANKYGSYVLSFVAWFIVLITLIAITLLYVSTERMYAYHLLDEVSRKTRYYLTTEFITSLPDHQNLNIHYIHPRAILLIVDSV
jgi:small-conductance mechanosensitive channel